MPPALGGRSLSCRRLAGQKSASAEDRGGRGDPGPDAGFEVAPDARGDRVGAAVALEALEVEAERFGPLPEVRIVEMALVGVDRVDHLEESALGAGRLGGGMQRRRAGALAGKREVAERQPDRTGGDLDPFGGAMRTPEVGVEDRLLALAANVIAGAEGRDRGAGQVRQAPSASKITLAPGASPGLGDS
jgi:hypothetical protein